MAKHDEHRWTIGNGGFLGEVTLTPVAETDQYVLREGRKCWELTNLFVHPLRRNLGWARTLVSTALAFAHARKADVFLRVVPYGVAPANLERLTKFYRSYGFRQVMRGDKRELVLRWSENSTESSG